LLYDCVFTVGIALYRSLSFEAYPRARESIHLGPFEITSEETAKLPG
uniref:Uncharacterized protein n=1 Tax=Parascaris equorum TaxID=6256 RepID=A0A914SF62_PAREQ